jgi:hypothetical protein
MKGTEQMKIFDFENMNAEEKETYEAIGHYIIRTIKILEEEKYKEEKCRKDLKNLSDMFLNESRKIDGCDVKIEHIRERINEKHKEINISYDIQKFSRQMLIDFLCGNNQIE